MKRLLVFLAALSLVAGAHSVVLAAEDKMTPQQEKMKACNAEAGDKKGDERKAFMSNCLKAGAPLTQQEKMKKCNADASAKSLKGDERKSFMSECLKGEKKS
jgi:hypothetical protein